MNRLKAALEALYARAPRGMELGLESIHASCTRFGHPETSFAAVHIAGTNGKGSTSAMVERIAREAGLKTGLYTSPHLHRFAERIRIAGEPLDDGTLATLLSEVLQRESGLTFFEAATLTAFLAFREARVDLAVLEVGIGGRLDATNVIPPPRAAAITRIAFDHQDKLGDTLPIIAREKAGIAKSGVDLILGPMEPEVERAIAEVAQRAGATISRAREVTAGVTLERIGLAGAHQEDNARIAWAIGERLALPREAIARGIANVTWPGRLERIETPEGPILLDAAHNPDGIEALAQQLTSWQLDPSKVALIFGALADKAWPAMLDRIAPFAAARIYVRPPSNTPRGPADPVDLAARCPGETAGSFEEALASARRHIGGGGLILITGSIFLVGEARGKLLGITGDPALAL